MGKRAKTVATLRLNESHWVTSCPSTYSILFPTPFEKNEPLPRHGDFETIACFRLILPRSNHNRRGRRCTCATRRAYLHGCASALMVGTTSRRLNSPWKGSPHAQGPRLDPRLDSHGFPLPVSTGLRVRRRTLRCEAVPGLFLLSRLAITRAATAARLLIIRAGCETSSTRAIEGVLCPANFSFPLDLNVSRSTRGRNHKFRSQKPGVTLRLEFT